MKILDIGGWEANPIVRVLMCRYGSKFWIWKFAIVSLAVIVLCLHSQFRRAKVIIISISLIYIALVVYQIFLITSQ